MGTDSLWETSFNIVVCSHFYVMCHNLRVLDVVTTPELQIYELFIVDTLR